MKGEARELETVSLTSISGTNYETFVTIWKVITNIQQGLVVKKIMSHQSNFFLGPGNRPCGERGKTLGVIKLDFSNVCNVLLRAVNVEN